MIAPTIEAPPNGPTSERQCSKGGACDPMWVDGDWYCMKCRTKMGPAFTENKHSFAPRTTDVVLSVRLNADDVMRLLASFIWYGEVFQDREALEEALTRRFVLSIEELCPSDEKLKVAREAIEKYMPELVRHLS